MRSASIHLLRCAAHAHLQTPCNSNRSLRVVSEQPPFNHSRRALSSSSALWNPTPRRLRSVSKSSRPNKSESGEKTELFLNTEFGVARCFILFLIKYMARETFWVGNVPVVSLFGLLLGVLKLLHDFALVAGWVVPIGVAACLLLRPSFAARAL